jgi:repressor LexA
MLSIRSMSPVPKPSRTKRGRVLRGETRERVFAFVRQALERGEPPTVRDVQSAFGFRAVETAREHLMRLVAAGRLVQEPGVARGYRLPPGETPHSRFVPLLGRVAAGALQEAIEQPEGHVAVEVAPHGSPRSTVGVRTRDGELFALRVHGESMTGLGILDGDIVIVRRGASVREGDIVVARIDGEATVKSFFRTRGKIELRPANPAFEPILVASDRELEVLGKVIEVRRYIDAAR